MNLLLFGVSNVGKSTTGLILSGKLGFAFHDLDDEVKQEYKTTLEVFVNTGTLRERDAKRCRIIKDVIHKDDSDKIIAVSPITYVDAIKPLMRSKDILAVELCDSAENIFDRLVFSDENDIIYTDDEYKNQHRDHYLEDINLKFGSKIGSSPVMTRV